MGRVAGRPAAGRDPLAGRRAGGRYPDGDNGGRRLCTIRGGFLGSLAAVLVLVAVPVVLLGAVAPYANRLGLGSVANAGTVTGGLYAISTAGSRGSRSLPLS